MASNTHADSTITIQNQCQQSHSFNIIQQQTPFLQLLAGPLVNVPGNSSYNLPVRFNANGLNPGQYQGTVIVKCESCSKEKTCKQDREILPVRLTVVDNAKPPQAVPTATTSSTPTPTPTPTPHDPSSVSSPASSPSPSPCAPAPTPTTYKVKDLGPLSVSDTANCMATGVNEAGNVIGVCAPSYFGGSGGAWHAFRTEPGAVIDKKKDDLGLPAGTTSGSSFALGVNADAHVVGWWALTGSTDLKAFWHGASKDAKMINLHPDKSLFTTSKAFAVNIHDDVVGAAYGPTLGPVTLGVTFDGHAVIWPGADPKKMKDLNDDLDVSVKTDWILKAAFGINDDGDIVGRAYSKKLGKYHAFLLKSIGGKFFDLGALKEDKSDSSAAYAINECDEKVPALDKVVGYTYTAKAYHDGFVWTAESGLIDMGTLSPYSSKPALLESFAQAINKKGEVIGAVSAAWHTSPIFDALGDSPGIKECVPNSHAVWYNGSELKDLNKLITGSPGWELNLANGINDKGLIAGSGYYKCFVLKTGSSAAETFSHLSHAVVLTPAVLGPSATTATGATGACPLSIPSGGYIFDNWNVCGVKNGPTKDTTFTIAEPSLVTLIATYHWNYGKGALATKGISLKDSKGAVFGPWPVTTSAGSGGAANVNWECHPGITLPGGTYTVIDPDPTTWSQNDASGNSGFARVAGSPSK